VFYKRQSLRKQRLAVGDLFMDQSLMSAKWLKTKQKTPHGIMGVLIK